MVENAWMVTKAIILLSKVGCYGSFFRVAMLDIYSTNIPRMHIGKGRLEYTLGNSKANLIWLADKKNLSR